MKLSFDDIREKVDELANKISAPDRKLPEYGSATYDGYPYIEIDNRGWLYYVVSERGNRQETLAADLDHLLYIIFEDVTFSMASDYELDHRIEAQDSRRIFFRKQEELMNILNETWGKKITEYHNDILRFHPFDDLAMERATYYAELLRIGYSKEVVDKMAYEKYPITS